MSAVQSSVLIWAAVFPLQRSWKGKGFETCLPHGISSSLNFLTQNFAFPFRGAVSVLADDLSVARCVARGKRGIHSTAAWLE